MENNSILDASETDVQYITTTTAERWVGYIEYIAIFAQITAFVFAIFTSDRDIDTTTTMIGGFAMTPFQWYILAAGSAYFILLLCLAPFIIQARGLGQVVSSYVVILGALVSLFGAFFKIQAWQYGNEMTTLGLFLLPLAIIIPVFHYIKDGKTLQTRNFVFNIIARLAGIFLFMMGGVFIIIAYKILKPRLFREK
jgi:glucan phosphoethanolaminetransferase (alkaline phosphatase superfamily)